MRIGNPLPQGVSTIQVGGITSPTGITTQKPISVLAGNKQDIAPVLNQTTVVVSNLDATLSVFIRDTVGTTAQVGTLVGPQGVAALDTSATIRVTNNGATAVAIAVNQLHN